MVSNLNDGRFRFHVDGSIPVILKASDESAAWNFSFQLDETVSSYSGGIWRLIESAICNGIDWPVWWQQYASDRERYFDKTAGLLFLDETHFPNDAAARSEKWRRVNLCLALGGLTSENVHFPDFYETCSMVRAEEVIPQIRWMNDFQLANYVTKCFGRHRFFRTDEDSIADANFWQINADEFETQGLVTSGVDIPLKPLLGHMPNTEMRKVLARFGIKSKPRRSANEELLHELSAQKRGVEEAIREAACGSALRCKMPPAGLEWSDLQAYRWQIRGMIGSLYDFLHNPQTLRRRYPDLFNEIFEESGLERRNSGFLF